MMLTVNSLLKRITIFTVAAIMSIVMSVSGTDDVFALSSDWGGDAYTIKTTDGIQIKFETLTSKGDATLLTITQNTGKKYVLIDTGMMSANVAAGLKEKDIKKIDTLIITHNDGDHFNGLRKFQSADIKVTNLYYNYIESRAFSGNQNFDALEYIKAIENKVITGKATRIRDAQNHSGTEYNVNMESGSAEYLRICRGRLFKQSKMDGNNGYDLIIFPAITDSNDSKWTVNNKSMMVVVQTAKDRVILGGDIQGEASMAINNYENSEYIKKLSGDDYSYYYGVKNYLLNGSDGGRYVTYKVSHHGTGTNRNTGARPDIIDVEKTFFQNMSPNALVLTGYRNDEGTTMPDLAYFQLICGNAAKYTKFAKKSL